MLFEAIEVWPRHCVHTCDGLVLATYIHRHNLAKTCRISGYKPPMIIQLNLLGVTLDLIKENMIDPQRNSDQLNFQDFAPYP